MARKIPDSIDPELAAILAGRCEPGFLTAYTTIGVPGADIQDHQNTARSRTLALPGDLFRNIPQSRTPKIGIRYPASRLPAPLWRNNSVYLILCGKDSLALQAVKLLAARLNHCFT